MRIWIALAFFCISWPSYAAQKGVGMWYFSGDKAAEVGASWYYNWTPYARGNEAEFVPMIWGERDNNDQAFAAAQASPSAYLMGFNEPDGCGSEAACMTPERAIAIWPRLMATGKKLVSPAIARDENWLRKFIQIGRRLHYRLEVIAIHHYPDLRDPKRAADEILGIIDRAHHDSKLPIWLTEFGALYNTDPQTVERFMDELIPQLNQRDYVERYAWFSDKSYRGNGTSALWRDNGQLSEIGEFYKNQ